ncbi:DNA repair protein RecN (Recombination protein N) [Paenimyroides ummariense]|uniref:DNA repair protein RecN n=1 Tax=Paenimyroides ummariense TaxID=913024 RepID=A0A1I5EHI9_9FLAO|nr:DNA repair protein RecN [Paenimyroides ummariense]SFO10561.1 DNA repair protein RecN (Recombination protein N) [Paenimyroides ummariense]
MLTHLSITNYALIAHTAIDFTNNLTIITGETGAGKSILLDALGLVLGKRADLNTLRNPEEKCVIEAHFNITSYQLHSLFSELDLDYENDTIVRREILPSGKSRAFVNDVPTTLQNLQQLGNFLIDIHTQHQTQDLFSEKYQLNLIDVYADNSNLLKEYQQQLQSFKKYQQQLNLLKEQQSQASKEQDYNAFLLDELTQANLKSGEQEELEGQFEVLANVEKVGGFLEQGYAVLSNEEFGITKQLYEVKSQIQKLAQISTKYENLYQRLESSFIELEDIADELQTELQQLVADPQQLELINQKLQSIYQLQKKHNVSSIDELLEIQNELSQKVAGVESIEEEIIAVEKLLQKTEADLNALAQDLHVKRTSVLKALSSEIENLIKPLGMPNAQFDIQLTYTETFLSNGKDEVSWLFSGNKGMQFGLLKKTASGGELSRIMLAVKSILAQKSKLPTIIFDEIDTGVSGDVADKMGTIMQEMGNYMQIFSITHLPQVASKGKQHFKVTKFDDDKVTTSTIKLLNTEERIHEIAQMLSGNTITDAALQHAKQLLN